MSERETEGAEGHGLFLSVCVCGGGAVGRP